MKLLQTQHEGRQQDFGLVNVVHSLMVLLLVDQILIFRIAHCHIFQVEQLFVHIVGFFGNVDNELGQVLVNEHARVLVVNPQNDFVDLDFLFDVLFEAKQKS